MTITVEFGGRVEKVHANERLRELVQEGIERYGELHVQWPDDGPAALCARPIRVETMFTVALDVFLDHHDLFDGVPICAACLVNATREVQNAWLNRSMSRRDG